MANNLKRDELGTREMEQLLEIIIEKLEKAGMLKGMDADSKKELAQNAANTLTENGVQLNRSNILDPGMQKKLGVLVVAEYVKQNDPSFQFNSELLLKNKDGIKNENNDNLKKGFDDHKDDLKTELKKLFDNYNKLEPDPNKQIKDTDKLADEIATDLTDDLVKKLKEEDGIDLEEELSNTNSPTPQKGKASLLVDEEGDVIENLGVVAPGQSSSITASQAISDDREGLEDLLEKDHLEPWKEFTKQTPEISDEIKDKGLDSRAPSLTPPGMA